MSQSIWHEIDFLIHTFLFGIMITVLYDTLRILRRLIKHGNMWIAIEDMGFWIVCSISIFSLLMEENNGILRWFAVLGSLLGMIIFKVTVSRFYVKYTTQIIQWVVRRLLQLLYLLLRPICFILKKIYLILRKIYRWLRKKTRIMKNALTERAKMVKIMLCKR